LTVTDTVSGCAVVIFDAEGVATIVGDAEAEYTATDVDPDALLYTGELEESGV
jgi:hypothetical protein